METCYSAAKYSNTNKEKGDEEDAIYIPPTATLVRVTNVIDPFHLRIYEIETYDAQMNRLERVLHEVAKRKLLDYGEDSEPQIGDLVLIDNRNCFNVDLPAWCCRGIVGSEKITERYTVFLPDHGIALNFWAEELKILPPDSISDSYLTSAVGLSDILPITFRENAYVSEQWSRGAVRFTREMIKASRCTYFDHLTSDKFGNKFGELYLILDDEIVALSKALVCNQFATIINDNLVNMIDTLAPHASTNLKENNGATEDRGNFSKCEENRGRARSTAVYARAFDGLLKKKPVADPDQEIIICSKIRCEQLNSVAEAKFPQQIHKTLRRLERPIEELMRLQRYVWPAITKGLNVVAVASQKSGKTMSYLVPIVSLIAANEIYPKFHEEGTHRKEKRSGILHIPQVPKIYGPLALILCVSSLDVYELNERCQELLRNYPKVKVLPVYNGLSTKIIVVKVLNGCEILIATPPYLTRLIKKDRKLLDFSRLSHVVFDGADVILDKYQASLGEILKMVNSVRNGSRDIGLQTIAIARHWTTSLNLLVNRFIEDPYVCIGSYMEAAVYAGLKPKLIFLPKNQKAAKVVEMLGSRWSMVKTIIVCTEISEAVELVEVLESNSIDTLLIKDDTIFTKTKGVRETWMTRISGEYFVLVCTDSVLSELNIKDAKWLIHYSLGSRTKSQFFYRFSTLSNNFSRQNREERRPKPSFTLMADESNDAQLKGVVNVLQRLEVKIPPPMEAYLEKIFIAAEMAKTDRILCESIKAFGFCPRRDSCPRRHLFVPDIDKPTTSIRPGDWVKLKLTGTHKHSANHYSARVVEYTRAGTNERVQFSLQELADLPLQMQKHYGEPANRRSLKTVKVGDVCAIEDAPGNYKRVQILSAVDKNAPKTQYVEVRLVDDGDVFFVQACKLFEIPENLAQWPSHIVDFYLTGIAPFDNEPTWSPCTEDIVRNWFEENTVYPTSCLYGKVCLHLGYVLWVDLLEARHKLQNGYPDLTNSSLKSNLIEAKCAMENKEHIKNLLDICRISHVPTDLFANSPLPETKIIQSNQ